MKYLYLFLFQLILIIPSFSLSAFSQSTSNTKSSLSESYSEKSKKLILNSFTLLPAELNGCGCCLSKDSIEFKLRKYIFVNDLANIAFLKINGVMTKFTMTEFKNVSSVKTIAKYVNDSFELYLEVNHGRKTGEETWFNSGTIKLSDKKGNTLFVSLYGECGC